MNIKKTPEDFVVEEIIKIDNKGKYHVYMLEKRNMGTPEAVRILEKKFSCKIKFCGNKDKYAVTKQYISVNKKIPEVEIRDKSSLAKTTFAGMNSEPLSLGSHKGNHFEINLYDIEAKKIDKEKFIFPNYFGEQRFSEKNVDVGTAILERDFEKAVKLIDDKFSNNFLEEKPTDFLGALKKIPKPLLRLYITSVQSFEFNNELSKKILGKTMTVAKQELNFSKKELKNIDEETIIMKGWDSGDRRFLFREYPEISLEGTEREALAIAKNISFDGKTIKFDLPKGSYATIFLRSIFLENITY